jgi:crotonobetainyl-CoA:carnitine CoA-transferase CaiB-like acyl-CoA transferase
LPAKPLEGIRVLEFAQIAAGPFTGMLLADLGADVVKVERPDGGDGMRGWPPLHAGRASEGDFSGNFTSLNRNKRSVALDIKDKADLAKLYALVENADIFIENFRPGALKRAGLGYDQLKARNPRLVYCSITGYGQSGPYSQKGAFDVTAQAMSGLMSVTGEEGRPPVKCGVPVGDFATGLYAAYVILAAVMRARETGKGAQIDCSILGSLLGIAALQTSEYFGTGVAPRRLGSAHPRNAPYAGFQASDKPFTIAAGNDKLWRDTCAIVGRPDLPDDPRFATQSLRAKNQNELAEILGPIFATRTSAEWLADFDAKGVPCAPINDFAEILSDPHVDEMGWVQTVTMPNGAEAKTVGFPIALTDYAFEITRTPPKLGEHNDEVMSEWTERRYAKAL